jgi:diguanylate cyclase (GGDEF)-like protein
MQAPLDAAQADAYAEASSAGNPDDNATGARPPRRLVATVTLYFVAFVVWRLLLAGGSARTRALTVDAALIPPGLAAIVLASLRSWSSRDPRRASAWRWISASFVLLTATFAIDLGYESAGGAVPFPSIADSCYLAFYLLFFIGVMRFRRRAWSRSERLRLRIDFATVALAGMCVIWLFVLGPSATATGHNLFDGAVAGAYPVGDLLQIFVLAYLVVNVASPMTERRLRWLLASALAAIVGDLAKSWMALHPAASLQAVVDITFMGAWMLFVLAPSVRRPPFGKTEQPAQGDAADLGVAWLGRVRWLPYLGPLVVLGLLVYGQFSSSLVDRVGLSVGTVLVCMLVLFRQVLGRRDLLSAQSDLSYQALHDTLTGLPNRTLVLDRLERMLARARRQLAPIAVLYVDIDGFKQVNDAFGHAAGDSLLQAVATRLTSVVREADTVARLGSDEFVVLLDSPIVDDGAELAAERVLEVLRQPVEFSGDESTSHEASVSIGVAVSHEMSADEMLRDADIALFEAKSNGKDRYAVFEAGMQGVAQDRLLLELNLRDALAARELFLLYQPTFDLRSQTISGVEALLRWRHPTRGVIAPDDFIPIAEESGLIVPIGRWVLAQACEQVAEWRRGGHAIGIAVNVSARQLDRDDLVADVRSALKITRLDPPALTLEITETTLMRDADATARRLRTLKELGVRIAIDDFGTGYSSLAYLAQFPVDAIKIDRSFVSGIAASRESHALIHTLVQLGKALELETLAEGIEEDSQLRELQREQCDSGQGFLFARPLEPEAVIAMLKQDPHVAVLAPPRPRDEHFGESLAGTGSMRDRGAA